jgi:hypothetical protein
MLKGAIEALREIQMANVASEVVYRRLGGESKTVKAVVGRTVFRSTDESGIWTRIETRDFIVSKGQMDFEPQVGDEIEFLGNTYEVLAPNGEPAWRWSDAFHTAYRIHAKHTGG